MKNLAVIAVVFWLLFLNGFSALRQLASSASLGSAPQTIIAGAARVAQTVQPATAPQPTQPAQPTAPVMSAARQTLIIPARMPVLPTATPEPQQVAAAPPPVVDLQATADAEARIAAWLAAPPEPLTPTPIPTEYVPAFKAEFQPAPECSPFVGYIGADKVRCAAFFATQTAVAVGE